MSSAFCLKLVSFLEPLHLGSLRHARLSAGGASPTRTALRHVTATEVGRALVPKLVDELLRSELACLNQVVRERLQQALPVKPHIRFRRIRTANRARVEHGRGQRY